MKIVSVNVSLPVEVEHEGKKITTSIFKKPIHGSVPVSRQGLTGDRQADLANHGGENKAVYAYSLDHYAYWQNRLDRKSMPYGQFGENLTVTGLDESACFIGDHLQIGSTVMTITQPRVPCFKLGIRLNDKEMPKLFTQAARTGFYLKILQEGSIKAGDVLEPSQRGRGAISVKRLFEAFFHPQHPGAMDTLKQALDVPELSSEWREQIERKLSRRVM